MLDDRDYREHQLSEQYLTTADLADLTRTTPETVRWWRHTSYGPVGFKVGRRVLYARSEVDAWLGALREREGATIPAARAPRRQAQSFEARVRVRGHSHNSQKATLPTVRRTTDQS